MMNLTARWKRFRSRLRTLFGRDNFLCDSCKLNYGSACRRRERPNATICEDYLKKY
ncbi:MAG: hypothetical protein HUU16_08080 [Candidatus Omnitrophica bacterium]|nr:hypothetical protein [bacterium]NUN96119.1 hypothetical protein [Candidatus Omnitrophota bacterium]